MQLYTKEILNKSALVQSSIGKPISVRIGIHSGPAHGAIVGGPKKFRYDILGDTGKKKNYADIYTTNTMLNPLL